MFEAFSDTIGLIYDAAADPSGWQAALRAIVKLFDGLGASLIVRDLATLTGRQVTTWDPDVLTQFWQLQPENPYLRRKRPPRPGTVEIDREVVPRAQVVRGPWYNEYCRPHDLHSGMFLWVDCRGTQQQYLTMTRPPSGGTFERSDAEIAELVLPHLRRALVLDRRLSRGGLDVGGAGSALDAIGQAVMLIGEDGAAVFANSAAEQLLARRDGLRFEHGRLHGATAAVTARLDAVLARAAGCRGPFPTSGTVTLPRSSGGRPLMLVALPLRRAIAWLRPQSAVVCVCVADPDASPRTPVAWLQTLFGLTAAEAEVAKALLAGAESNRDIAGRLGISHHTVHTHLARIMGKTGAKRQTELIRLLSTLTLFGGEQSG